MKTPAQPSFKTSDAKPTNVSINGTNSLLPNIIMNTIKCTFCIYAAIDT
jgi:hypothetical protein